MESDQLPINAVAFHVDFKLFDFSGHATYQEPGRGCTSLTETRWR
jgi:hypothetical protein